MRFPIWLVAAALCATAVAARAQDEGGPLLNTVELSLQNDEADDQILKLARAAKVNIMADVSDGAGDGAREGNAAGSIPGPARIEPLTVSRTQPLIRWMLDIAYANRMSWQRTEGNTIVLWPKPDIVPTTRRVVDGALGQRPQIEADVTSALRRSLGAEVVARLDAEPGRWHEAIEQQGLALYEDVVAASLRTLLQEKHGWDGRDQGLNLRLKDEQIPPGLRSQIILYRRLAQALPQVTSQPEWLRDETWRNARLMVEQSAPSTIGGKAQPRQWGLSVTATVDGRQISRSVATLVVEGIQGGGGR